MVCSSWALSSQSRDWTQTLAVEVQWTTGPSGNFPFTFKCIKYLESIHLSPFPLLFPLQFPNTSHLGFPATFWLCIQACITVLHSSQRVMFQKCRSDLAIPCLPMVIRIRLENTWLSLQKPCLMSLLPVSFPPSLLFSKLSTLSSC